MKGKALHQETGQKADAGDSNHDLPDDGYTVRERCSDFALEGFCQLTNHWDGRECYRHAVRKL